MSLLNSFLSRSSPLGNPSETFEENLKSVPEHLSGVVQIGASAKEWERTALQPGFSDQGVNLVGEIRTAPKIDIQSNEFKDALDAINDDLASDGTQNFALYDVLPEPDSRSSVLGGDDVKSLEGLDSISSKYGDDGLTPFSALRTASLSSSLSSSTGLAAASVEFGNSVPQLSSTELEGLALATVPAATAAQIKEQSGVTNSRQSDKHLVTLTQVGSSYLPNQVRFEVMPEIVEDRTVEYEAIAPSQFPGAFQKYKGTSSVQWSVNATFVCRTTTEATKNLQYLNLLRGWTMPFFGDSTAESAFGARKLGAPPPVLRFKGFGKGIIGDVPTVITSLNWNWPKDVDYIPAYSPDGDGLIEVPFPSVMQVAIRLVEAFSTKEFNGFNLEEYYNGNMAGAYLVRERAQIERPTKAAVPKTQNAQQVQPAADAGRVPFSDARFESGRALSEPVVSPASIEQAVDKKLKESNTPFRSGNGGNFGGAGAGGSF